MKTFRVFLGFALVSGLLACSDESSLNPQRLYLDLPDEPYSYSGANSAQATLGRVLFYDTRLSINNAISCGTCHKQAIAFSDNVALSRGFENKLTHRNSLPIQNLSPNFGFMSSPTLFWDGREEFLQAMVLKPIVNHVEMGMGSVDDIAKRVQKMPYYAALFEDAYGNTDQTPEQIAMALAAFTGSIQSANTKFDMYESGMGTLNGQELLGKNLFFDKYNCNSCHQTQALNGYQMGGGFVNIGLDQVYADNGRGAFDNNAADNGKFKIPNLRNIVLTAPYMHDGRFATLNEVLNHYSSGIKNHPNLDPRLRGSDNNPLRLNITAQDKAAIIAFLGTLTDYSMITDPRYSNPFKTH